MLAAPRARPCPAAPTDAPPSPADGKMAAVAARGRARAAAHATPYY